LTNERPRSTISHPNEYITLIEETEGDGCHTTTTTTIVDTTEEEDSIESRPNDIEQRFR
jgi:hypothetical protein